MLILGRTTKTAASRTELYTYTRSLNRGMTPFGFLLVEFLWHLRLLKGSDLSSASPLEMQFSQSSPSTQHKPNHVLLTKTARYRLFILFQVCVPFAVREPQKARCEEGWIPGSHDQWAHIKREDLQSMCWLNRHAPTADLWLANGNKVPTKNTPMN